MADDARVRMSLGRCALAISLLTLPLQTAQAATMISASATAFLSDVRLASGATATLTPAGAATGTAPPAFSESTGPVSYSGRLDVGPVATGPLYLSFGANSLTSSAQGDTESPAGSASTMLAFAGFGLLVAQTVTRDSDFASFSASALGSTTTFDGANFVGTSNVTELYVNRDNRDPVFYSDAATSFAPNTIVWDRDGHRVVLNEQILTENMSGDAFVRSLTTNALHIRFTGYAIPGSALSGDVIAGQSRVSVSTTADVPEPATWAMMMLGFGLIGATIRRRGVSPPALARTSAR
ncbi:PEPxxWA-CTERM sorting domain-containing protein [Sphingomonas sp. BIUV-7]|uniref:PEPxxWA-CTERM sorting domain-containing protein n=1 Tax=Sphingomonas natans TaxID=3063330 RepID=A0ABT8YEZ0_9SPHN|nr:PEPxxWA-CTERM sorting domain-containing protein [Sphingomonas sp. BIUV-7]MDO6416905.1 PEPxxWA-CTERM sorting domain-containing protein [Sphingomonas sp. BIUV-7]